MLSIRQAGTVAAGTGSRADGDDGHGPGGRNDTTWTVQSTPNPPGGSNITLAAVACGSATACVAVGGYFDGNGNDFLAEVWNGNSWSIRTVPLPAGGLGGGLASVSCSSPTLCTTVGDYADSANVNMPFAAVWDGNSFSVESVPFPSDGSLGTLDAVSCSPSPSKDCETEGWYFISGQSEIATTLAEGWDGTGWSIQTTPTPDDAEGGAYPTGLSCHQATSCVSVGEGDTGDGDLGIGWAQVWNGSSWSDLTTTAPPGATASVLSAISCSTTPSTKCAAVGYYYDGSTSLGYAQRIGGSHVSLQKTKEPVGATSGLLDGVSCSSPPATCSAVGTDTNKKGVAVTLANGWNGKTWSVQKTPNP